jgi:hypothetical protein
MELGSAPESELPMPLRASSMDGRSPAIGSLVATGAGDVVVLGGAGVVAGVGVSCESGEGAAGEDVDSGDDTGSGEDASGGSGPSVAATELALADWIAVGCAGWPAPLRPHPDTTNPAISSALARPATDLD